MPSGSKRAPGRGAKAEAPGTRCCNCGADADWHYCPNCGQETAIALPSAFAFLRDAAGRYIRFDGRMWRSLHALAFRPGFLTREYLAGRRRRYVRPARLFVALSIVVFAVLRFSAAGPAVVATPGAADPEHEAAVEQRGGGTSRLGFDVDPDLNVLVGPHFLVPLQARIDAFNRLPRDEKANQVIAGMFRYAPYAAIGLLPLFALLLKLVYAGSGRRHPLRPRMYGAHLVFGAHTHAFLFAVTILFALVRFGPVRAALLTWATIYAVASLNRVYGGSVIGAALRAALVALGYSILFGIAVAALVVVAVILR
jgi:rRNA maturation protein Nop10